MLSHKKSLNILKKTNALLEGHFILSSGLHSSKYIQCAKLLSFPNLAEKICKSLANQIKKKYKKIDLILAPAMGGIIIGYEIGRLLKKETIFCERVKGKFTLRRGFYINKGARVRSAPFGGYGSSGNGREHGTHGLEECLETKAVIGALVE